jgi:hypothetical protein
MKNLDIKASQREGNMSSESITNCEHAIKQVKSVMAARIKTSNTGEIEEIHVLAGPGRNPKQVVRDVESVLIAQFGLQVDHKKISVAQVVDEEELLELVAPSIRPRLMGVTLRTVNNLAEARVELSAGGQILEGIAEGPASTYNKLRIFVDATIKAIESFTLEGCFFVADDVAITVLAKLQVAQVAITMLAEGREQPLVGCAMVGNDVREAVVKATLDAVNRKLRVMKNI